MTSFDWKGLGFGDVQCCVAYLLEVQDKWQRFFEAPQVESAPRSADYSLETVRRFPKEGVFVRLSHCPAEVLSQFLAGR